MWKKARLKLSSTLPSFQFQPQFLPLAPQPSSPDTQGLHLTQIQTGVLLRTLRWCLRAQFNNLLSCCASLQVVLGLPRVYSSTAWVFPLPAVATPCEPTLHTPFRPHHHVILQQKPHSSAKTSHSQRDKYCMVPVLCAVREVKGKGWISFFSFPTLVSGTWSPLNLELLNWLDRTPRTRLSPAPSLLWCWRNSHTAHFTLSWALGI